MEPFNKQIKACDSSHRVAGFGPFVVPLNPGPSLERYSFSDNDATETERCRISQLWVMQHAVVEIPYMRIRVDRSELNYWLSLEHPSPDDLQMAFVLKLAREHRSVVQLRFVESSWHDQRRVIRGVRMRN